MPLKIQRENSEDAHLSPARAAIQTDGHKKKLLKTTPCKVPISAAFLFSVLLALSDCAHLSSSTENLPPLISLHYFGFVLPTCTF